MNKQASKQMMTSALFLLLLLSCAQAFQGQPALPPVAAKNKRWLSILSATRDMYRQVYNSGGSSSNNNSNRRNSNNNDNDSDEFLSKSFGSFKPKKRSKAAQASSLDKIRNDLSKVERALDKMENQNNRGIFGDDDGLNDDVAAAAAAAAQAAPKKSGFSLQSLWKKKDNKEQEPKSPRPPQALPSEEDVYRADVASKAKFWTEVALYWDEMSRMLAQLEGFLQDTDDLDDLDQDSIFSFLEVYQRAKVSVARLDVIRRNLTDLERDMSPQDRAAYMSKIQSGVGKLPSMNRNNKKPSPTFSLPVPDVVEVARFLENVSDDISQKITNSARVRDNTKAKQLPDVKEVAEFLFQSGSEKKDANNKFPSYAAATDNYNNDDDSASFDERFGDFSSWLAEEERRRMPPETENRRQALESEQEEYFNQIMNRRQQQQQQTQTQQQQTRQSSEQQQQQRSFAGPPNNNGGPRAANERITVSIRDSPTWESPDGETTFYQIKTGTVMGKVMSMHARRRGVYPEDMAFQVQTTNGGEARLVNPSDTVLTLELEDGGELFCTLLDDEEDEVVDATDDNGTTVTLLVLDPVTRKETVLDVRRTADFAQVFEMYAERKGLWVDDNLSFTLAKTPQFGIRGTDTLDMFDVQDGDILVCETNNNDGNNNLGYNQNNSNQGYNQNNNNNNDNNPMIRLVIRDSVGEELTLETAQSSPLSTLFEEYANLKGSQASNLNFVVDGIGELDPLQTPIGSGLQTGDVIVCNSNANSSGQLIFIHVQEATTGQEWVFRVRKSTRMSKVFDAFAQSKGISSTDAQQLSFQLLDGRAIDPSSSPLMLKLEDGDRILCTEQTSGYGGGGWDDNNVRDTQYSVLERGENGYSSDSRASALDTVADRIRRARNGPSATGAAFPSAPNNGASGSVADRISRARGMGQAASQTDQLSRGVVRSGNDRDMDWEEYTRIAGPAPSPAGPTNNNNGMGAGGGGGGVARPPSNFRRRPVSADGVDPSVVRMEAEAQSKLEATARARYSKQPEQYSSADPLASNFKEKSRIFQPELSQDDLDRARYAGEAASRFTPPPLPSPPPPQPPTPPPLPQPARRRPNPVQQRQTNITPPRAINGATGGGGQTRRINPSAARTISQNPRGINPSRRKSGGSNGAVNSASPSEQSDVLERLAKIRQRIGGDDIPEPPPPTTQTNGQVAFSQQRTNGEVFTPVQPPPTTSSKKEKRGDDMTMAEFGREALGVAGTFAWKGAKAAFNRTKQAIEDAENAKEQHRVKSALADKRLASRAAKSSSLPPSSSSATRRSLQDVSKAQTNLVSKSLSEQLTLGFNGALSVAAVAAAATALSGESTTITPPPPQPTAPVPDVSFVPKSTKTTEQSDETKSTSDEKQVSGALGDPQKESPTTKPVADAPNVAATATSKASTIPVVSEIKNVEEEASTKVESASGPTQNQGSVASTGASTDSATIEMPSSVAVKDRAASVAPAPTTAALDSSAKQAPMPTSGAPVAPETSSSFVDSIQERRTSEAPVVTDQPISSSVSKGQEPQPATAEPPSHPTGESISSTKSNNLHASSSPSSVDRVQESSVATQANTNVPMATEEPSPSPSSAGKVGASTAANTVPSVAPDQSMPHSLSSTATREASAPLAAGQSIPAPAIPSVGRVAESGTTGEAKMPASYQSTPSFPSPVDGEQPPRAATTGATNTPVVAAQSVPPPSSLNIRVQESADATTSAPLPSSPQDKTQESEPKATTETTPTTTDQSVPSREQEYEGAATWATNIPDLDKNNRVHETGATASLSADTVQGIQPAAATETKATSGTDQSIPSSSSVDKGQHLSSATGATTATSTPSFEAQSPTSSLDNRVLQETAGATISAPLPSSPLDKTQESQPEAAPEAATEMTPAATGQSVPPSSSLTGREEYKAGAAGTSNVPFVAAQSVSPPSPLVQETGAASSAPNPLLEVQPTKADRDLHSGPNTPILADQSSSSPSSLENRVQDAPSAAGATDQPIPPLQTSPSTANGQSIPPVSSSTAGMEQFGAAAATDQSVSSSSSWDRSPELVQAESHGTPLAAAKVSSGLVDSVDKPVKEREQTVEGSHFPGAARDTTPAPPKSEDSSFAPTREDVLAPMRDKTLATNDGVVPRRDPSLIDDEAAEMAPVEQVDRTLPPTSALDSAPATVADVAMSLDFMNSGEGKPLKMQYSSTLFVPEMFTGAETESFVRFEQPKGWPATQSGAYERLLDRLDQPTTSTQSNDVPSAIPDQEQEGPSLSSQTDSVVHSYPQMIPDALQMLPQEMQGSHGRLLERLEKLGEEATQFKTIGAKNNDERVPNESSLTAPERLFERLKVLADEAATIQDGSTANREPQTTSGESSGDRDGFETPKAFQPVEEYQKLAESTAEEMTFESPGEGEHSGKTDNPENPSTALEELNPGSTTENTALHTSEQLVEDEEAVEPPNGKGKSGDSVANSDSAEQKGLLLGGLQPLVRLESFEVEGEEDRLDPPTETAESEGPLLHSEEERAAANLEVDESNPRNEAGTRTRIEAVPRSDFLFDSAEKESDSFNKETAKIEQSNSGDSPGVSAQSQLHVAAEPEPEGPDNSVESPASTMNSVSPRAEADVMSFGATPSTHQEPGKADASGFGILNFEDMAHLSDMASGWKMSVVVPLQPFEEMVAKFEPSLPDPFRVAAAFRFGAVNFEDVAQLSDTVSSGKLSFVVPLQLFEEVAAKLEPNLPNAFRVAAAAAIPLLAYRMGYADATKLIKVSSLDDDGADDDNDGIAGDLRHGTVGKPQKLSPQSYYSNASDAAAPITELDHPQFVETGQSTPRLDGRLSAEMGKPGQHKRLRKVSPSPRRQDQSCSETLRFSSTCEPALINSWKHVEANRPAPTPDSDQLETISREAHSDAGTGNNDNNQGTTSGLPHSAAPSLQRHDKPHVPAAEMDKTQHKQGLAVSEQEQSSFGKARMHEHGAKVAIKFLGSRPSKTLQVSLSEAKELIENQQAAEFHGLVIDISTDDDFDAAESREFKVGTVEDDTAVVSGYENMEPQVSRSLQIAGAAALARITAERMTKNKTEDTSVAARPCQDLQPTASLLKPLSQTSQMDLFITQALLEVQSKLNGRKANATPSPYRALPPARVLGELHHTLERIQPRVSLPAQLDLTATEALLELRQNLRITSGAHESSKLDVFVGQTLVNLRSTLLAAAASSPSKPKDIRSTSESGPAVEKMSHSGPPPAGQEANGIEEAGNPTPVVADHYLSSVESTHRDTLANSKVEHMQALLAEHKILTKTAATNQGFAASVGYASLPDSQRKAHRELIGYQEHTKQQHSSIDTLAQIQCSQRRALRVSKTFRFDQTAAKGLLMHRLTLKAEKVSRCIVKEFSSAEVKRRSPQIGEFASRRKQLFQFFGKCVETEKWTLSQRMPRPGQDEDFDELVSDLGLAGNRPYVSRQWRAFKHKLGMGAGNKANDADDSGSRWVSAGECEPFGSQEAKNEAERSKLHARMALESGANLILVDLGMLDGEGENH